MSKWWPICRVPENMCFPPTSVRVIVLITIIFALIATVFAVAELMWHDYGVATALGAVAATTVLSEEALRRLTRWQRPHMA